MMNAAARILRFPLPLAFILALGCWSTLSHGQDDVGNAMAPDDSSSGTHPMKFKIPDEDDTKKKQAKKTDSSDQDASSDEGFKTYVGYPKHQLGLHLVPEKIAAAWTYQGATYNFVSNSLAYGLNYNLIITPSFTIGLEYTHFAVTMPAATANGNTFLNSSQNFDNYFAKFRYCFISDMNFERRFCPGIDIGNDSYPVLQFLDQTTLTLANVSDIIVGVNATGTMPVKSLFVLKGTVGYNMGTGMGNSGVMTSKTNSSYYADVITDWKIGHNVNYQHAVQAGVAIKERDASISGTVSNQPTTWNSKVLEEGLYLGYNFTF